jgi:hypothetical protein
MKDCFKKLLRATSICSFCEKCQALLIEKWILSTYRWELAIGEGREDTIELELLIDILLLLLKVGRTVDPSGRHDVDFTHVRVTQ